jgi:hypothetical protein
MISDKGVLLDIQLTKERLKMTKDIPLSQSVGGLEFGEGD